MIDLNFSKKITDANEKAMQMCSEQFSIIDSIQEHNEIKMLKAFQNANVSLASFSGSNGYGYDDPGRDKLDMIYSYVFDAEDALVRHSFASGTHTLTVALFGMLRPGDKMFSVTGMPYDTLQPVIGVTDAPGSLKEFGVDFSMVPLKNGKPDLDMIEKSVTGDIKMAYIQRSRGYETRDALTCGDIKAVCERVRRKAPHCVIMLDNCYGEFIDKYSPLNFGVDVMAGSLIKNAGGGIAQTGGYIAGRKDLVELCSYRLTTPATGKEIGCTLNTLRDMFLGAYFAPIVTANALKTVVFASALFEILGYDVTPSYDAQRADIIEIIKLGDGKKLEAFCKGIQSASFIDSSVVPYPAPMPGYDSDVIMAAGAFTLGSSIELSADGPMREPYNVYLQGGLSFNTAKLGILSAAQEIENIS